MALSSSTPVVADRSATSEMTDSTSERHQHPARPVLPPLRGKPDEIDHQQDQAGRDHGRGAMIVDSVISPLGVRSWNATDSASSVSDRYSRTSNHSTFLGTVIVNAGHSFIIA